MGVGGEASSEGQPMESAPQARGRGDTCPGEPEASTKENGPFLLSVSWGCSGHYVLSLCLFVANWFFL